MNNKKIVTFKTINILIQNDLNYLLRYLNTKYTIDFVCYMELTFYPSEIFLHFVFFSISL